MKKVLFVVGSFRKNSFNMELSKIAKEALEGEAEVSYLEYSDLPYLNQDEEFPAPRAVARVREEVAQADAVWVFSPEYNFSYPGALKNLFDWLSRPLAAGETKTAAQGKKVAISGIGGQPATANVRAKLEELLKFIKMDVLEDSTGAIINAEAWGGAPLEVSDEVRAELKAQAAALIKFIG